MARLARKDVPRVPEHAHVQAPQIPAASPGSLGRIPGMRTRAPTAAQSRFRLRCPGPTTRRARGVVAPQLGFGQDSGSAAATRARAAPTCARGSAPPRWRCPSPD